MIGAAQKISVFTHICVRLPGEWYAHMGTGIRKATDVVAIAKRDHLPVGPAQIGDIAPRGPVGNLR